MSAFIGSSVRRLVQRKLPELYLSQPPGSTAAATTAAVLAAAAAAGAAACSSASDNNNTIVRLDYWEHDPGDFDVYVRNPTERDLPVLLHKYEEENLEVWPWIWTHPNDNGPHFVFVGMDGFHAEEIRRIRSASENNNILVILTERALAKLDKTHPGILTECHCGVVTDSPLSLLNAKEKILMLEDERVIAYDYLTIIEP